MRVRVKKSTVVRPAAETPRTTIGICNLDSRIADSCYTSFMLFYRFNGNFFEPALLKAALSRAMVHFYPVAGRLQRGGSRLEINCNGDGVLFVEAECDGQIDELGDFCPRGDDVSFTPMGNSATDPLFLAQLTHFQCGGVCLGISSERHLSDGVSTLHFITSWSKLARAIPIPIPIPITPRFDDTILVARNPPRPNFTHIEYQRPPSTLTQPVHYGVLTFKRLKLDRKHLNSLKHQCTTYEAVAAHAWRCVCKARQLSDHQETKMYIAVDGRSRWRPPLRLGFFGSATFTATPIDLVGNIVTNPLNYTIRNIRKAIERVDDEYMKSALDYLELVPNANSFIANDPVEVHRANIVVTAWDKLPFYEVDFGWGRPVYAGPAKVPFEGKSFVLADGTEDGCVWYAIALPEEHMQLFEKHFYEDIYIPDSMSSKM